MITEKDSMRFFDEDGGEGGEVSRGTAVFEGDGEPQPPTTEREEPTPDRAQPVPSAPSPSVVDARQLAAEFGSVLGQQFRPPPKEITVEEAKRLLNVWEPSPEWLAKYDNLETRNAAIAEQRDGLIRQADTIMQFRMREMMNELQQTYGPVVQHMQAEQARQGEQRFSQVYPQLGAPGLRPVLFAVAQSLLANGTQFQSEKQMFDAVAKGVESVIKVNNPDFSLGTAAATKPRGRGPGRTGGGIPVTTPGSGAGGGGGEPANAGKRPRGLAIWD